MTPVLFFQGDPFETSWLRITESLNLPLPQKIQPAPAEFLEPHIFSFVRILWCLPLFFLNIPMTVSMGFPWFKVTQLDPQRLAVSFREGIFPTIKIRWFLPNFGSICSLQPDPGGLIDLDGHFLIGPWCSWHSQKIRGIQTHQLREGGSVVEIPMTFGVFPKK